MTDNLHPIIAAALAAARPSAERRSAQRRNNRRAGEDRRYAERARPVFDDKRAQWEKDVATGAADRRNDYYGKGY